MKKQKYYAVRKGKNPGVYLSWDQCKDQVHGFKGAQYKSFLTEEEARSYMGGQSLDQIIDIEDLGPKELIAYVDGSYNPKDQTFSYGLVLIGKDYKEEASLRLRDPEMAAMRNVSGEIYGAKKAMERALELNMDKIYIHYDYAGIEYWAKGEWKANKKGTQAYKQFYDTLKDKLEVVFVKVQAHTGVAGNERADQLAKEAIEDGGKDSIQGHSL